MTASETTFSLISTSHGAFVLFLVSTPCLRSVFTVERSPHCSLASFPECSAFPGTEAQLSPRSDRFPRLVSPTALLLFPVLCCCWLLSLCVQWLTPASQEQHCCPFLCALTRGRMGGKPHCTTPVHLGFVFTPGYLWDLPIH